MAKSTPAPKKAKSAAKTPVVILSDKEKVEDAYYDEVSCIECKNGFVIVSGDLEKGDKPLHSGIAKTKDDAWKLAAHNL